MYLINCPCNSIAYVNQESLSREGFAHKKGTTSGVRIFTMRLLNYYVGSSIESGQDSLV